MNTAQIGYRGEERAAMYLQREGYKILERNYRLPWGEIDLIAQETDTLVFVEVKTWRTFPSDQIPYNVKHVKKSKILTLAKTYIREHPEYDGFSSRFDLLFIHGESGEIEHFKHAFDEGT